MFLMNVFVMLFFICDTLAYYKYNLELISPNVGSVLFTRSDLNKKHWSKDKIKLLQARKHFQRLIPYPHSFGTVNEDYLNTLLSYFKETYSTVKREIKNSEINNVMNAALSDAIGGYFKVWVLPITKFAYYGGTISMEKAIDVFKLFEGIKTDLSTDGQSWHKPTEKLLKSVEISVVPRSRETITRSMKNPCKHLAYYEKTDKDLSIPLPVINWNINPITIFVPLKNQTLVPISSINSSNILLNFYTIADKCMQDHSLASSDNFRNKFQTWLTTDVTPHLNDDNLYLAFGNILTLINDTNKLYGMVTKNCNDVYEKDKTQFGIKSVREIPKKYIIIAVILLVELIWCLPSLLYILRNKKNNRQKRLKDKCFKFFKRKHGNWNIFSYYTHSEKLERNFSDENIPENGVQLVIKPRAKKLQSEIQYPSCKPKYVPIKNSKSYYKGMFSETTNANVFPKKSSMKKIVSEFTNIETDHLINKHNKPNDIQKLSKVTRKPKAVPQDPEEPRPLLTISQDEQTIKEINYSQESSLKPSKTQCKSFGTGRSSKKLLNQCSFNLNSSVITDNIDKATLSNLNRKQKSTSENIKIEENKPLTDQTIMHTEVDDKGQTQRQIIDENEIKKEISKSSKVKNSKPLLRIRIEKPRKETSIKVGITSIRENSNSKPSKIPRLAVKRETKETHRIKNGATNFLKNTERSKVTKIILRKNLIESTLDDTAIKRTRTIKKKLNETV